MLYGGSVEFEKSRSVYIKDPSGYVIELSEISGEPATGYEMSPDEEVVVFLKSQSKSDYDLVYGEDGITYACGYEDAACHGVDVDYAGE